MRLNEASIDKGTWLSAVKAIEKDRDMGYELCGDSDDPARSRLGSAGHIEVRFAK